MHRSARRPAAPAPAPAPRRERNEDGITVLRLLVLSGALVLVLTIGSLVIRTRSQTNDHLAKAKAEAAATAASHLATETGQPPTAEQLAEYEPSIEYESLEPGEEVAVQGKVYVRTNGQVAELAARGGDTCYWIQETPTGRRYAKSACDADPDQLRFTSSW